MKFESRETRMCTRMQIGFIYESGYSRRPITNQRLSENPSVHKLESRSRHPRSRKFYHSLFAEVLVSLSNGEGFEESNRASSFTILQRVIKNFWRSFIRFF